MCNDKKHSERRETDRKTGSVEIARCRRDGEDLSDDKARAVTHAGDNAEGCGVLEVADEIGVEPDDAEADLGVPGQRECWQ